MEGTVSNVDICNLAYAGHLDKIRHCIITDKTLASKTDQVIIYTSRTARLLLTPVNQSINIQTDECQSACQCDFQDNRTPLHWACSAGHSDIVQFLLDLGVDVNLQDDVMLSISRCTFHLKGSSGAYSGTRCRTAVNLIPV